MPKRGIKKRLINKVRSLFSLHSKSTKVLLSDSQTNCESSRKATMQIGVLPDQTRQHTPRGIRLSRRTVQRSKFLRQKFGVRKTVMGFSPRVGSITEEDENEITLWKLAENAENVISDGMAWLRNASDMDDVDYDCDDGDDDERVLQLWIQNNSFDRTYDETNDNNDDHDTTRKYLNDSDDECSQSSCDNAFGSDGTEDDDDDDINDEHTNETTMEMKSRLLCHDGNNDDDDDNDDDVDDNVFDDDDDIALERNFELLDNDNDDDSDDNSVDDDDEDELIDDIALERNSELLDNGNDDDSDDNSVDDDDEDELIDDIALEKNSELLDNGNDTDDNNSVDGVDAVDDDELIDDIALEKNSELLNDDDSDDDVDDDEYDIVDNEKPIYDTSFERDTELLSDDSSSKGSGNDDNDEYNDSDVNDDDDSDDNDTFNKDNADDSIVAEDNSIGGDEDKNLEHIKSHYDQVQVSANMLSVNTSNPDDHDDKPDTNGIHLAKGAEGQRHQDHNSQTTNKYDTRNISSIHDKDHQLGKYAHLVNGTTLCKHNDDESLRYRSDFTDTGDQYDNDDDDNESQDNDSASNSRTLHIDDSDDNGCLIDSYVIVDFNSESEITTFCVNDGGTSVENSHNYIDNLECTVQNIQLKNYQEHSGDDLKNDGGKCVEERDVFNAVKEEVEAVWTRVAALENDFKIARATINEMRRSNKN